MDGRKEEGCEGGKMAKRIILQSQGIYVMLLQRVQEGELERGGEKVQGGTA